MLVTPSRLASAAKAVPRRLLDPRVKTPSFAYKNEEMRRVRRIGHGFGVTHPVWSVNDKDAAHRWAQGLGLRTPRLLGEHPEVTQVPWDRLPDRFVLKPVKGAGSRGVFLLQRSPQGWRELRSGSQLSVSEVQERYAALARSGSVSPDVLLEELVEDPQRPGLPPVDWKVHTFFGRVGLVLAKSPQVDAAGRPFVGWRIFDEHWTDLGRAATKHPVDRSIQPPAHAEQVLEVARLVSSTVPRAFLRVDLYDSADGVVFGEVTPEPGGSYLFRRDVDRMLGERWEEAEARLLARAVASGILDTSDHPLPESAAALTRR